MHSVLFLFEDIYFRSVFMELFSIACYYQSELEQQKKKICHQANGSLNARNDIHYEKSNGSEGCGNRQSHQSILVLLSSVFQEPLRQNTSPFLGKPR